MTFHIHMTQGPMPADVLGVLPEPEAFDVLEVSTRTDTTALYITQNGKPIAYAVFGFDLGEMVTVYQARSMVPVLGPMIMKQFFGVAQIIGKPLRMHVQSLRDIAVKARIFGATIATPAMDADGILQGVFDVK